MDESLSLRQSTIVLRCRCTACVSCAMTLCSVLSATYRMLLSRLMRKRPRMLTARTRRPDSTSIAIMVRTHSYRIALPAFFADSVFVATCARMSFIWSDVSEWPRPRTRSIVRISTWRKGSTMPCTSCSGAYPESTRFLSAAISVGVWRRSCSIIAGSVMHISRISLRQVRSTAWLREPSSVPMRSRKVSHSSGHLRRIRMQQSDAFFDTNGLEPTMSFSTSGDRSRQISAEEMLPMAQQARPAMYWLDDCRSFFSEFSTSMSTSCRSSSRIMSPR
mmetsp:Transcript_39471/g.130653  ORF Transcript_39471/g.130653 Transcript_39471/m.130653 type:complete len:276 (-) Transcript_39471:331-1158(-)